MSSPKPDQILSLYRQIRRVHRSKLPPPLRDMGDSYASDEFRRHRDEKTTQQQWLEFVKQWQRYVTMLSGQADHVVSGDMGEDMVQKMTPEQKLRLKALEEEARNALG